MGHYATKVRKNYVRQHVHNCGREKAAFILRGKQHQTDLTSACRHGEHQHQNQIGRKYV